MRTIKLLFILASLVILGIIAGCGGAKLTSTTTATIDPTPKLQGPQKAILPAPKIVFFGDSTVTAWLTPAVLAQHPGWIAMGTPPGVVQETTAELLARETQVLSMKPLPDIIVVMGGTWDVLAWTQQCLAGDPCPPSICDPPLTAVANPCQNIQQLVQNFGATEAYVIVSTVPPWGPGPLAAMDAQGTNLPRLLTNLNNYNFQLEVTYGPENSTGEPNVPGINQQLNVSFMDAYAVLAGFVGEGWIVTGPDGTLSTPQLQYATGLTTDGISPSAAGGQQLTQAVMIPIQNSGRGQAQAR